MTVPLSHEVLGAPPDMVRDKVADFWAVGYREEGC
jgi:hypothetical protein